MTCDIRCNITHKILIETDEPMNCDTDRKKEDELVCRLGCGACCIAPSISSPIPGMPKGKPAGVRCIQLSKENLCNVFDSVSRPTVCGSLRPSIEMCGSSQEEAMRYLQQLEADTLS